MKMFLLLFLFGTLNIAAIPVQQTAQNNGCAQITRLQVAVDPPRNSDDTNVMGVVYVEWTVVGQSPKVIEININGGIFSFVPDRPGGLFIDLLLLRGGNLEVTVNTYTSSIPGRGNLCSSETRIVPIL